jgi:hypothetical protein
MKLIYFSSKTMPKTMGGGNKLPKVSFGKAGTITFNHVSCQLMGLKNEDKITLSQDEEVPENWYFFKDNNGFALRSAYDKKGCLFNHSALVQAFIEAVGAEATVTNAFIIAGTPTVVKGDTTKYWGILISNNN